MAKQLSQLAVEKKARHPSLLDVRKVASYTDFVLILGATSDRHARALADHITRAIRDQNVRPLGVEGQDTGQWILIDFNDVIVHVLQENSRDYYDLDGLWIDAQHVAIEEDAQAEESY